MIAFEDYEMKEKQVIKKGRKAIRLRKGWKEGRKKKEGIGEEG
jgi:hypothetical protein